MSDTFSLAPSHAAPTGSAAPTLAMGRVALTVHDIDRVAAFYQQAIGLHLLRRDGETAEFGAAGDVLLELRHDPAARRRSPREAGLFHTAFLLPDRTDLARFVQHLAETRTPVVGASDHEVSEAIYLSDPEGNGVEVYADRPASAWEWSNGLVRMSTDALDIPGLVASAGDTLWGGFPAGSKVGHVHLQVGAITPAEAFYAGTLGLAVTCRYPGATFFAADGYHHHIATNIWNSRGAEPRSYPSTGLTEVEIRISPERLAAVRERAAASGARGEGELVLQDPWNTAISLVPVPAI